MVFLHTGSTIWPEMFQSGFMIGIAAMHIQMLRTITQRVQIRLHVVFIGEELGITHKKIYVRHIGTV